MTVTGIERLLRGVADELRALQKGWALIGGLAVSARAEPRFTRDLDLAVAVENDHEAETLVADLRARGYEILALVEHEAVERLATVRLNPPGAVGAGLVVDLLMASSGIEAEVVSMAEMVEIFSGLEVPLARVGHLLALKLLARDDQRRPQDLSDIHALLAVADASELALAEDAVAIVTARGFHRGRDLLSDLRQLLSATEE